MERAITGCVVGVPPRLCPWLVRRNASRCKVLPLDTPATTYTVPSRAQSPCTLHDSRSAAQEVRAAGATLSAVARPTLCMVLLVLCTMELFNFFDVDAKYTTPPSLVVTAHGLTACDISALSVGVQRASGLRAPSPRRTSPASAQRAPGRRSSSCRCRCRTSPWSTPAGG
eukprot:scaffold5219_cov289-Prasinococcus_capsulatus_cf.AAC.3